MAVKHIINLTVLNVQVCAEMGVDAPISVSMKSGDMGNFFRRIVDAAQRPHLSIPETEQGRTNKHYKRLIQRSLTVAAGKLITDGVWHIVKFIQCVYLGCFRQRQVSSHCGLVGDFS